MRFATFLVLFCACSVAADAATLHANSCSRADVGSVVDIAMDGDTVIVPAGSCTWVGTLTITKSITLQGAGIDLTTITDGNVGDASFKPKVLAWHTKSSGGTPAGFSRLTGFTFHGGWSGNMDPGNDGHLTFDGDTANLRIDHNKFIPTRGVGIKIQGFIRGVIDHNTFQLNAGNFRQGLQLHHPNWGNVGGYGDNSWAQPLVFGTADFIFVEDNTFTNPDGVIYANDGWMGQRVVYRRNTYVNAIWANHGTETGGRPRSARGAEIYQNTFIANSSFASPSFAGTRGGTHMVFDNTITTTNGSYVNTFFDLTYLRQFDTRTFYAWGWCDGANPWDGNQGPGGVGLGSTKGYPCTDQPGFGKGAYVSGDLPQAFPLKQEPQPIYVWNNIRNGSLDAAVVNWQATVIQNNRELYNQSSSFNGGSGVGRGPLSSRPGACTTGVAYWATDQGEWDSTNDGPDGQLYKCVSTNSWTLFYVPYTYPHPMVRGVGTITRPLPPNAVRMESD